MTKPREQLVSLEDTPYYHCIARCVRRAYLFGEDALTNRSYNHRKQWVVDQITKLAHVFTIDVCAYAVMTNHYHLVLKIDASKAAELSDKEVLTRWMTLFNGDLLARKALTEGETLEAEEQLVLTALIEKWRARLMDVSWFMRCLNETIARMANKEDGVKGRFWEGRFKSQALLDDTALLTCMTYVDLNPIRAALAGTPESSDFTSIQQRIREMAEEQTPTKTQQQVPLAKFSEPNPKTPELEKQKGEGTKELPFYLQDYLNLIDWAGRAIREDKRGYIKDTTPPILLRLGISPDKWLDALPQLEAQFHQFMGEESSMRSISGKKNQKWVKGVTIAKDIFGSNGHQEPHF